MRTNTNSQTNLRAAVTLLKFRLKKLVDTFHAAQAGLEITRITSTRLGNMHKKLINALRNPANAFSRFCFLSPHIMSPYRLPSVGI
jgi:hypothetical protein